MLYWPKEFLFTLLIAVVCTVYGAAQVTYTGKVVAPDGESLAFVSVIAQADTRGIGFTDVEGHFSVSANGPLLSITFRYVGFQEKVFSAEEVKKWPAPECIIELQVADNSLTGVDIIAGENPADIIIRKAVANRHRNNPEWKGAYQCKTYNKIYFETLLNRQVFEEGNKSQKSLDIFSREELKRQKRHLFMMETVTERSFLAPYQLQERILLNRVSGFKNAEMVALANAVQPFSFYGDYLSVLDKKFLNPISPGSDQRYAFQMKDTLYDGTDTVWVIAFKPKKGKIFMALLGVLHVHSHFYAVKHVIAHPAFGNENLDMNIEQAYRFIPGNGRAEGGQWFPEQLNFEIHAARYPEPGMGLSTHGLSYISDIHMDANLNIRDFNTEQPLLMEKDASSRDTLRWAPWRQSTPLSAQELNTYAFIDSLGQKNNFDRVSKVLSAFRTGVWPLKKDIGIRLSSLVQFNDYERTRLGIGLTNAQSRPLGKSRRWEWGAGVGYGIKDKRLKENVYLLWRIRREMQTHLRLDAQNDLLEPGTAYELNSPAFLDRSLYAQRMDFTREISLRLSSRLSQSLSGSITVRHQNISPASYNYAYLNPDEATRFQFREATAFLRFARGEQTRSFIGNSSTIQRWPVLELAYTHGNGTASYSRVLATVYQSVFIRKTGYFKWRLEGGVASATAPLSKLFTLNQIGGGFALLAVNETFQSLPDTLLLHNRYANLYLAQEIGPILYQKKRSAPFLSILQNVCWGDLAKPELHQGIGFQSIQKPFFESGVKVDNLLRFNYINLGWIGVGAAVYYRWGYLHDIREFRNFTPRLSLKFTL